MGGRGASSASAKLGKQAKSGSMPSKVDMAISAAAAGRAPDNLSDFTNNSNDMRRVSRALQANGLYSPWLQDKLTDAEIQNAIAKWKGSSSYVRKNVQYRDDKTSRHSQGFDDWPSAGRLVRFRTEELLRQTPSLRSYSNSSQATTLARMAPPRSRRQSLWLATSLIMDTAQAAIA